MGCNAPTPARLYRPRYRRWLVLAVLFLAALARVLWLSSDSSRSPAPIAEGAHAVERVVDGDTLLLVSGHRVRLQGVNTPELARDDNPPQPLAPEARDYSQAFVNDAGGRVTLTFTDERLDRYGRTLAFVWSGEHCLNVELVREGLAEARLDYRFSGIRNH